MRRGRALVAKLRGAQVSEHVQSLSIRTKIVLMTSVVVAGICVPAALATTLTGEEFFAREGISGSVSVNCGGLFSSFSYHAEGTATGPHLGTFVEDGEVVVGPREPSTGLSPVISLDATFTVMSSTGDVRGEKHLLAPAEVFACSPSTSSLILRTDPEKGDAEISEDFVPDPTLSCRAGGEEKVTLCHHPPGNPENAHTIEVGVSAVPHHLGHGDTPGPCLP
jgi:hypothetical protein